MHCGKPAEGLSGDNHRAGRKSCAPQHRYNARMKTTAPPPPLPGADDALFDEIERRLRALTTAPLHAPAALPRRCVDEFADGFLGHAGPPPSTARQPARRLQDPSRLRGDLRGYL